MRFSAGTLGRARLDVAEDELSAARLDAARKNKSWREIEEPVNRGRFYVDAASDEMFRPYRGAIFAPQGSAIEFAFPKPLVFYVGRSGAPVFLEPLGRKWSAYFAQLQAGTK